VTEETPPLSVNDLRLSNLENQISSVLVDMKVSHQSIESLKDAIEKQLKATNRLLVVLVILALSVGGEKAASMLGTMLI
tara:strand:- start:326 stop:562 length:237 start_codon:yes stop_codon:yes gene_type:complete